MRSFLAAFSSSVRGFFFSFLAPSSAFALAALASSACFIMYVQSLWPRSTGSFAPQAEHLWKIMPFLSDTASAVSGSAHLGHSTNLSMNVFISRCRSGVVCAPFTVDFSACGEGEGWRVGWGEG